MGLHKVKLSKGFSPVTVVRSGAGWEATSQGYPVVVHSWC